MSETAKYPKYLGGGFVAHSAEEELKLTRNAIPSGGERQCPTCGSNDKKHHLCTRCRRSYWAHLGHQIDSSLARGQGLESHPFDKCSDPWHDQPTPAAQLGMTSAEVAAEMCPELTPDSDYQPVSAEATKPESCPCGDYGRPGHPIGRWCDQFAVVPPVAPPEADGAEPDSKIVLWLDAYWQKTRNTPLAYTCLDIPVIAELIASYAAQKEAEISRLTAERQHVASSTYGDIVRDFPGFAATIEPHVWDNMSSSEQRDYVLAANTELRTALLTYGHHLGTCEKFRDPNYGQTAYPSPDITCSCGLAALAKGE